MTALPPQPDGLTIRLKAWFLQLGQAQRIVLVAVAVVVLLCCCCSGVALPAQMANPKPSVVPYASVGFDAGASPSPATSPITSPTTSPTPSASVEEQASPSPAPADSSPLVVESAPKNPAGRAPTSVDKPVSPPSPALPAPVKPAPTKNQPAGAYYANCAAARAAGAAPLHRGDPGYRSGLDRDGDGIACET